MQIQEKYAELDQLKHDDIWGHSVTIGLILTPHLPRSWSHLRLGVQSICLLFISRQSDNFQLIYRKFHMWPWQFKVKIIAKFNPYRSIWGQDINSYVCFLFRGNWIIFGWNTANIIVDLDNSRSMSCPRWNLMIPCEAQYSIDKFASLFRGNWTIFGRDKTNFSFDIEAPFPKMLSIFLRKNSWKKVSNRMYPKFDQVESMTKGIYLPSFVAIVWAVLTLSRG